jgi:hypothetical protein
MLEIEIGIVLGRPFSRKGFVQDLVEFPTLENSINFLEISIWRRDGAAALFKIKEVEHETFLHKNFYTPNNTIDSPFANIIEICTKFYPVSNPIKNHWIPRISDIDVEMALFLQESFYIYFRVSTPKKCT